MKSFNLDYPCLVERPKFTPLIKITSTWYGPFMYTVIFPPLTCYFHVICLYSLVLFFLVLHEFNKEKLRSTNFILILEELFISINISNICYSANLYWNPNRLNTRELYLRWNIRQDVLRLFQINKVFWYVFNCDLHLNTPIEVLLFPSLLYLISLLLWYGAIWHMV